MKKILFICMVAIQATTQTNGQMLDTTLNMHKVDANSLLLKAKKQKTAAWILLASGAGLAITGFVIMTKEAGEEASATLTTIFTLGLIAPEEPKHSAAGPVLAIAGTGAMLGSIPLFIASGKNKGKAHLILKTENVFFSPQVNVNGYLVAAGIKINL